MTAYLITAVVVGAAITFALRALPFAAVDALRRMPMIDDISRWMPAGAILILAVYSIHGIKDTTLTHGVAELAGIATVVVLHLWRRNMVLSMVAGTAVCVLLTAWL